MAVRFNAPPGWPPPPKGFSPPLGWQPDPDWPPAPPGWKFWVVDEAEPPSATEISDAGNATAEVASTRRRNRFHGLLVVFAALAFGGALFTWQGQEQLREQEEDAIAAARDRLAQCLPQPVRNHFRMDLNSIAILYGPGEGAGRDEQENWIVTVPFEALDSKGRMPVLVFGPEWDWWIFAGGDTPFWVCNGDIPRSRQELIRYWSFTSAQDVEAWLAEYGDYNQRMPFSDISSPAGLDW